MPALVFIAHHNLHALPLYWKCKTHPLLTTSGISPKRHIILVHDHLALPGQPVSNHALGIIQCCPNTPNLNAKYFEVLTLLTQGLITESGTRARNTLFESIVQPKSIMSISTTYT